MSLRMCSDPRYIRAMTHLLKLAVALTILGVIELKADPASATQTLDGAFRVTLESTVLEYDKMNLQLENPNGAAPNLESTQTSFGLIGSGVGLGLGGMISGSFLLGARVSVGTSQTDVLGKSTSATALSFLPGAEW